MAKFSSDLERQLHQDLFLEPNKSVCETKATKWIGEMAKREADEAQTIARLLKQFYVGINRWKGVKKKQKDKVNAVKKVLGE